MDDTRTIGTRIREIRAWRRKSLSVVAGLAGISKSYLSMIEQGERAVDRRSLVEAIANALQVSPSELLAQPFPASDPVSNETRAALGQLELVLAHNQLDSPWSDQRRPWPQLAAELRRLNTTLRPACDYAGQADMLPALIEELYATAAVDSKHRRDALTGLMHAGQAALVLARNHGTGGLPNLAAMHVRQVAEELDTPEWLGVAAWLRVLATGSAGRDRALTLSLRAAEEISMVDSVPARQVQGMHHLNAALAAAALRRPDEVRDHLAEADMVARMVPDDASNFAHLYFGATNIGIWRVTTSVELGEGAKAGELAERVDPNGVPSAARQAMFYADLGRGLASERKQRDQAVHALRTAEQLAPQRVRTHPFVRETVVDLMRQARRDAMGRELRGLAFRMGIAA